MGAHTSCSPAVMVDVAAVCPLYSYWLFVKTEIQTLAHAVTACMFVLHGLNATQAKNGASARPRTTSSCNQTLASLPLQTDSLVTI